jgi:hypothetical protein
MAAASTASSVSAELMRRWTSLTLGAVTVDRVVPGGVARSAGLLATMPHSTAWSRAAWRMEW